MRNFSKLAFAALLAFTGQTAFAAPQFSSKAAGTTGSDFLNLGVGARPLGMGGGEKKIFKVAMER
jgi:hypothetical protein